MEEEGEEGWAVELGISAEDTVLEDNLDKIAEKSDSFICDYASKTLWPALGSSQLPLLPHRRA